MLPVMTKLVCNVGAVVALCPFAKLYIALSATMCFTLDASNIPGPGDPFALLVLTLCWDMGMVMGVMVMGMAMMGWMAMGIMVSLWGMRGMVILLSMTPSSLYPPSMVVTLIRSLLPIAFSSQVMIPLVSLFPVIVPTPSAMYATTRLLAGISAVFYATTGVTLIAHLITMGVVYAIIAWSLMTMRLWAM